jgi:hypothetical protein
MECLKGCFYLTKSTIYNNSLLYYARAAFTLASAFFASLKACVTFAVNSTESHVIIV